MSLQGQDQPVLSVLQETTVQWETPLVLLAMLLASLAMDRLLYV